MPLPERRKPEDIRFESLFREPIRTEYRKMLSVCILSCTIATEITVGCLKTRSGGNADGLKAGMKCMLGSTPGTAVSGTPAGENKLTVYPSVAGRGEEIRVKLDSEKSGDALPRIFSFPDRRLPGQDRIRNGWHLIRGIGFRERVWLK